MMTSARKVVVVFSGGMDSTTLLHHLIKDGRECVALNFGYGSKHNGRERAAAIRIAAMLGVKIRLFDLKLFQLFKSNLLVGQGEIPEGHYASDNMKQTVVPFRNAIMSSIAVGYAESIGFDAVALAAHTGDHAIYPDCRETFFSSMFEAAMYGTESNVQLLYPFIHANKTVICKLGIDEGAPLGESWTCYKGNEVHCGVCGACNERKEAFRDNGLEDPTTYKE